jgi:hypothetical protein
MDAVITLSRSTLISDALRRKKTRLGIKWFDGNIYDILYISESKNGVVYGVPKDDRHITIVNETSLLSSHLTTQKKQIRRSVSRIEKSDLFSGEEAARTLFRSRPIPENRLDDQIFYITQKWADAINSINVSKVEEDYGDYRRVYFDISAAMEWVKVLLMELDRDPNKYSGICKVRDLLIMDGRIGLLENNRIILRSQGELMEIDWPFSYPLESDNKLMNDVINFTGFFLIKNGVEGLIDQISKKAKLN